jgi:hypothetical protein
MPAEVGIAWTAFGIISGVNVKTSFPKKNNS